MHGRVRNAALLLGDATPTLAARAGQDSQGSFSV